MSGVCEAKMKGKLDVEAVMLLPDEKTVVDSTMTRRPAPSPAFNGLFTKVILVILFGVVVSFPLMWFIQHGRTADQTPRIVVVPVFTNFAFPSMKEDYYNNHHDGDKTTFENIRLYVVQNFYQLYQRLQLEGEATSPDDSGIQTTTPIGNEADQSEHRTSRKPNDGVKQCDVSSDDWRFDCHPENDASQAACEARGCCWALPHHPAPKSGNGIGVPYCYYPKNYPPSYQVYNKTTSHDQITVFLKRVGASVYPKDVQLLRADVTAVSDSILHTKIYDPLNHRYEVPIKYPGSDLEGKKSISSLFDVVVDKSTFKIVKKSTGQTIFDLMSVGSFTYADQVIQVSGVLPSKFVYGLGERRDAFLRSLNWQKFTMHATDQAPRSDSNLYGSHPFFMVLSGNGQAQGVWLKNSNSMDAILQPAPAITFRITGGVYDQYTFLGPSPADVIRQYTEVIGRPMLPPYWGLGFHLCKFGYGTANKTRQVWQRTRDAGIPFDVQWNDIDYMDNRRDFTYDKKKFAELPQLVKDIHDAGMHYVPIIDPALDVTETPGEYPPYDEGIKQGIFINDTDGKPFVGKVWSPHGAVWPDFTNPRTQSYWTDQFRNYHNQVPFDGAWIDMNEPSNFYDGTGKGCPNSTYETPPFVPGVNGGKMSFKTVCMTAQQYASIHYNVHNLYGFTETINTNVALKTIRNKRPFIISRSTFPGQGHYGGHWTGDIYSTWDDMQKSIPGILDFSLFGVPIVGADICGFNGNTTAKLCQRWMELGAFYPFSRNHNTDDGIEQDPVALGPDVVRASVKALTIRYMMLPYLYTNFYRAHQFGDTVARPLFFEFPTDKQTYAIDTQFLWGAGMMILPVLKEDVTVVDAYFPAGNWYLFNVFKPIQSKGEVVSIPTPLDTINVAFRGGFVFPFQATGNTTTQSRKNKFGLIVAFDANKKAAGELYWDDGDSLGTTEAGRYNLLNFTADQNSVVSTVVKAGAPEQSMALGLVLVMGVENQPTQVVANSQSYPFQYLQDLQMLIAYNMSIPMTSATITVTWK